MNTRPGDPGYARPDAADPSQRMLTEIVELRVKATGRDRQLLRLGAGLMVAGPLVTVVGYLQSTQAQSPMYQNDATIIALIGMTTAIVGTGLFLRYSLGEFLRFWMARMVAEQQREAVLPRRAAVPPIPAPNPNPNPNPANGRQAPAAAPPPPPPAAPRPPSPPYPPRQPMAQPRPEHQ